MLLHNAVLASLLILPAAVLSFKIDASCATKGVDRLVRDAMTNAFSMADSAVRRLNQDPYDEHTVDLIRLLFLPKDGQDPNNRVKMGKVLSIFNNIIEYYRTETTGPLDQHDIVRSDTHRL